MAIVLSGELKQKINKEQTFIPRLSGQAGREMLNVLRKSQLLQGEELLRLFPE